MQGSEREPLGLILTGGMGTRLRPLTREMPKSLVPVLNRPLIDYGLELLAAAGLRDVVVVVGGGDDHTGRVAQERAPESLDVSVALQPEPRGSGDAVVSAGKALDGRRVVVLPVDAILHGSLNSSIEGFMGSDSDAWLVLSPTDRPQAMGIAVLEGDRVTDFEEKPQNPRSDLALCAWMLGPVVVERLRRDPFINQKGESDLSATIALMLREGARVGGSRFDGRWLDAGAIGSLLDTQSILLDEQGGGVSDDAQVEGSSLHDPVMIGSSAVVVGCELGPNVVIGPGAELRDSSLRDALVVAGGRIEGRHLERVVVTASGEVGEA